VYYDVPLLNPASSRSRGKARSTEGRQNHYSNTPTLRQPSPSAAFEDDDEDGNDSHTYSISCMKPKSMCSCWWQWKSVRPGLSATKSNSTS
jgi:hypothetical protein